jgi:hypothetical protein
VLSAAVTTTTKSVVVLEEPKLLSCTSDEYEAFINGDTSASVALSTAYLSSGIMLFTKRLTNINEKYEGIYATLIDNTNMDPNSDYDSVRTVKTVDSTFGYDTELTTLLPEERLNF